MALQNGKTLRITAPQAATNAPYVQSGTPVQIYNCNNNSAQQWNVNADGTIVHVGSGKWNRS